MKKDETRLKLINGTIEVIANYGLDKATTKQIGLQTGLNEVYIYRCFENKEALFAKCFDMLDDALVENIMQHVSIMYVEDMDFELRCRFFFTAVWSFLLGHKERCLAFVQYYYSPYFSEFSADAHRKRYDPVLEKFKDAFNDDADVWLILNHILNVMLDFAVKAHKNLMPKEDNYVEHIFRVTYASVKQYFRDSNEKEL